MYEHKLFSVYISNDISNKGWHSNKDENIMVKALLTQFNFALNCTSTIMGRYSN